MTEIIEFLCMIGLAGMFILASIGIYLGIKIADNVGFLAVIGGICGYATICLIIIDGWF